MNRYFDIRAWLTAIMIGLTSWLGWIATSSYDTLVELAYRFEKISENIVMLKDTIESNNQSLRTDVEILKSTTAEFDRRLTRLEARSEK